MASFRPPVISGRSPPDTSTKATTQCRYYPNCTKPGCEFKHDGRLAAGYHQNNQSTPICKFGEKCRYINTGCKFIHPSFDQKVVSVSQPCSVRNNVSTTQVQDDDEQYENEWRESFNRGQEDFDRSLGL